MLLALFPILGPRSRRGLSLQEMLIVVAVFTILAFIFLFSSRLVMIKTHYSRVRQDQRTLANALNLYQGDHSAYPTREEGLQGLVGSYMVQLPTDPFSDERRETYAYRTYVSAESGRPFYVLISPGPDGDFDFDSPETDNVATGSGAASQTSSISPYVLAQQFIAELTAHTYDPTNGIGSDGDIIEYR